MPYQARQDIVPLMKDVTLSGANDWRECTVTFSAEVWAASVDQAYLMIDDGVDESVSVTHPGDSTWKYLSVTRTISEDATQIMAIVHLEQEEDAAGALLVRDATFNVHEWNRDVRGGCPCCGSFLYDPRQRIIKT